MPYGIGQRRVEQAPPYNSRHSMAHPLRTDRADLGFLVLMSIAVLAGFYGALMVSGNFHEVVPQRVYRSGQPSPDRLRAWIDRYGLKTIVNLRGPTAPLATEERAVALSMGVDIVYLELSAYNLMSRAKLVQLIEVLQTAREPILLHCYHGVDRAGTASALAAWFVGGQPYDRAKWQAYVPPGPWKRKTGSTHISDVLTLYEDYCREHGLNPNDPALFKHWAAGIYHPRPSGAEHAPASSESPAHPCSPLAATP